MRLVNERLFSSVVFAVCYPLVSFLLFPPPLSSNCVALFHHVLLCFQPLSAPTDPQFRPTLVHSSFARILIFPTPSFLFPRQILSVQFPFATSFLCLAKFPRFPTFCADTSTSNPLLPVSFLSLNTYICIPIY